MKLGLGTVQFGLDYGISNRDGMTARDEVGRILELARRGGIRLLDTAVQYGEAETAIGQWLPAACDFQIVTKTPLFRLAKIGSAEADRLEQALHVSLTRLRQPSVYGLLIHHCDDIFAAGGRLLFARMEALKRAGLVRKIGVSAYSPGQIDRALDEFPLDLLQAPFSVLDQRLAHGGQLERMRERSVEFHARSVFLQGLLLMNPGALPDYFAPWRTQLSDFRRIAHDAGMTPLALALRFVADRSAVDRVVCGVNNSSQLEELLRALRQPMPLPSLAHLALDDAALLDPSRWPQ